MATEIERPIEICQRDEAKIKLELTHNEVSVIERCP
jgi:hypothetical protein